MPVKSISEPDNKSNINDSQRVSEDDSHSFAMKVSSVPNSVKQCYFETDTLLVDSGSSTHIVTDKAKFTKFDTKFEPVNHVIELADGSRQKGIAQGRGNANIKLCDSNGNLQNIILKDALYIPSYKSDIFSVRAATKRGATVEFTPDYSRLTTKEGTTFELQDKENYTFLIRQLIRTFLFVQHIVSIRFLQEIQRKITKPFNNGITF